MKNVAPPLFFAAIVISLFSCNNPSKNNPEKNDSAPKAAPFVLSTDTVLGLTGNYAAQNCIFCIDASTKKEFDDAKDISGWVSYFHFYGMDGNNTDDVEKQYDRSRDSIRKADSGKWYDRDDSSLTLILKSGKGLTLPCSANADVADNYVHYDYNGHIAQAGFFYIDKSMYEDDEQMLFNDKTGDHFSLRGDPQLSPSGKYFLSASAEDEENGVPGGFQLYSVNKGQLTLLFNKDCNKWYPQYTKWADDSTVFVMQNPSPIDQKDTLVHYARIRIRVK